MQAARFSIFFCGCKQFKSFHITLIECTNIKTPAKVTYFFIFRAIPGQKSGAKTRFP